MKKILYFLCVYLSTSHISSAANVDISWPLDYSVFQRNTTSTGGSSTVAFAGQFWDGSSTQFRIEMLDNTGTGIGDWQSYQSLPGGSETVLGTSVSTYFYFTLSVPTGWYKFYIKDGSGTETSVKFGVGEVFIIAGQSNAQGTGLNIPSVTDLDCVVSLKNHYGSSLTGFSNLEKPVFGPFNSGNSTIGPRGNGLWFYQKFGNSIATKESGVVIPVSFINVAHGGSSIDNWYDSMQSVQTMFGGNYGNVLTVGSTTSQQNPWGSSFDNRFPYMDLKNTVSYWGNMCGVRSVIWHQGEAETKTLLSIYRSAYYGSGPVPGGYSIGNYDTKLNAIIADTRAVLPNLPWAVSKVTLMSDMNSITSTQDYDITNNSGNNLSSPAGTVSVGGEITQEQTNVTSTSNVSWAAPSSDTYTNTFGRRSDGTHFNAIGLGDVYVDAYSNIASILGKSPVLPAAPARMQLSQIGPQHHTLSTGSYYLYQWYRGVNPSPKFDQTSSNQGNSWASSSGTDFTYAGYVKDASGRVYSVLPHVYLSFISGARLGAKEENVNEPVAYPNPAIVDNELHIQFTLLDASPVKIQLVTPKGVIVDEINDMMVAKGDHTYTFPLHKAKQNAELSLIIYKLLTNEHNESKKILLKK